MMTDIVVPSLGESVAEATVAKWFKQVGDSVQKDEPLVELETDKVTLEVNAPVSGALKEIKADVDENVEVGAILGSIEEGAAGNDSAPKGEPTPPPGGGDAPKAQAASGKESGPAVNKLLAENPKVNPSNVPATGKDGRLTKGDVLEAIEGGDGMSTQPATGPREERVKMSKLRQVIARRLKESQNTAAILTTFNEIDMSNVMALRSQYKDEFEKQHGVRLGFMGFFAKAAVNALKQIPEVNAEINGDEIVYKNYYDIGIAVGTPQGLVVPVIRDCDKKSLAQIEAEIGEKAVKAREGTLSMSELTGGSFTVSNGGVYGSLMSTPIINPPQSGILGMHKTEQRPVVVDGEIVIRPMMYVALSYDHRIVDGRESVTFLVKVKEALEDPRRLLLGL
ncbi:MAG: 2-oxoglutarate dehydrogenase complex dihydrolipoyllysine-residue succinyltransferase [Rickettsiales bacterium]|nr:2-oxoglutarate dehydrogenase complex dihydrolipoyllysine-residue succinyltransferase [Rickettsiales bacterium]